MFKLKSSLQKFYGHHHDLVYLHGIFVCKITILRKKNIFFSNFRGGRAPGVPPLDPPLENAEITCSDYVLVAYDKIHRHSNSGPPFSSFGPSRDYGMDLCLEVYL